MSDKFGGEFLRAYSSLLSTVWGSDEELARLMADPTAYAKDKGLPVADGSTVRVDRTPHEGLLSKSEIVASWTETPGAHVLRVPPTAPIDLAELTEAELDAVAAGHNFNVIVIPV
jgi:hypothetical protein